jgi:uncharacterized protein (TIGR02246 family)
MNSDEQQIRDVVTTWLEASRRNDLDRVLELMDEDVVFLGAGRPPMRGKQAFAAASRAMEPGSIDGRADIQEVQVSGDLAYVWTQLTVHAKGADGTQRQMAGPVLSVLRRKNGRWLFYRDANMLAS